MRKYCTIIAVILFSINSFSQKAKQGIEYKINIDNLISAKEIVWYGVDFSRIKISDAKWFGNTSKMKDIQIPQWISSLNKSFDLEWISDKLKKEKVTSDLNSIQILFKNIKETELVTFEANNFPIDSITSIVEHYKIPQTSGIGLVLIMENVNSIEKYASGYFTFFDINTKQILYATEMKGFAGTPAGGPKYYFGYSEYWMHGMREMYTLFFRYYEKATKKE